MAYIITWFKKWIVYLFFTVLFIVGLLIYRGYGLGYDDVTEHTHGLQVVAYVFDGDKTLLSNDERYHGPLVEVMSVLCEKIFHLTDTHDIYLFRHFLVFLWFYAGVMFFYFFGKWLFHNRWQALLGCLFLVLSPRIFGHAFFNTKDIPAMSAVIISIFTMLRYLEDKIPRRLFWHSLACAISVAIRLTGIFVVAITLLFLLIDIYRDPKRVWKKHLNLYPGVFLLFTCCLWPILLLNPLYEMARAFKSFTHIVPGTWLVYCGVNAYFTVLPWHYVPVWISVTTPLLYLLFFIIGIVLLARRLTRQYLIVLLWFFVPIISVIVFRSILYDSWRHLYFIYPALLLIAVFAIGKTVRYLYNKNLSIFYLLCVLIASSLVSTGIFMIRNYPLEYIYFNRLAGKNTAQALTRFEGDYWALSYRQGMEYLAKIDHRATIKVYFPDMDEGLLILPYALRARFKSVDFSSADYYLTEFRDQDVFYPYTDLRHPSNKIYSLYVDGGEVMAIYML